MSFDRFSHSFPVAAPAAKIYAHLMVPQNYVGLSPLVVEVRDVHPTAEGATAYTAVERFRFGPLKWDNLIKVILTGAAPDKQVVSRVKSPGWVTLLATVDLSPTDTDHTQVTETVELTTPWFLRRFAVGQAKSVQKERAAELARRFTTTN